ncbi:hypothetical protein NEMIN01_0237 [Nematocida minor]|uniref:uncharacterized protein n=1 Tax=Nematocida minor TaxID=1912983 RepID=UPI002221095F|nr:uncharacterized protein NEMIN01_0237 [Nematocida minor]KAI5188973.1 hypothetical protein NEMIN01_0237 [Nematocida minor]
MFNAEKHFLSKTSQSTSEEIDTGGIRVWLGNTPYSKPPKKSAPKEPVFPYKNITEKVASDLHSLFLDFIEKVRKESANSSLTSILYKMELLGALVSPIHHREECSSDALLKSGIVVNETKNTLAIAFKGAVKIYPKAMHNFVLHIRSAKYFIIGPALKLERRFSK